MSLATYADLQTAIGNELNRADLASVIPDFVTRFEARARRELRDWLRFTVTATNVTTDYTIAATVAEVLSVNYNDGTSGSHNFQLQLVPKERYQELMDDQSILTSLPGQVAYVDADIDAGTTILRFWPPTGTTSPIANLKVEGIKVLPSLSASQTTNALLREAPDLYLHGSLAEAGNYLQHDERIPAWEARVKDGFRMLRIQTERKLYSGEVRSRPVPVVFG